MYYGKRPLILCGLAAIVLGTGLHFLYQWAPNPATALFSPVNESLWEHIKLVYWPYLLAALWLNRGRPGGLRPWLLTLPVLCALTLGAGYLHHITLGERAMWMHIAIYVLVMALGFWLPTRFSGPFRGVKWVLPIVATVILGLLLPLFTLWPPDNVLFVDFSQVDAWLRFP